MAFKSNVLADGKDVRNLTRITMEAGRRVAEGIAWSQEEMDRLLREQEALAVKIELYAYVVMCEIAGRDIRKSN